MGSVCLGGGVRVAKRRRAGVVSGEGGQVRRVRVDVNEDLKFL